MRLVRLAAAALALAAAPAAAQNAPLELLPGETLLEVEAEGVHRSRPDIMEIRAGVVTTGSTAAEAMAENAVVANRLVEAVRTRGIDAADLRTARLAVQPRHEERDRQRAAEEERRPRIIGYVATNTLEIRLRDLRDASALLDALLAAGANEVSGPDFELADEEPALAAARRDAVRQARIQADTYAASLGMRVARVLRVSERQRYVVSDGSIIVSGSGMRPTPIEPGEIETDVTVWVDFALAPQ